MRRWGGFGAYRAVWVGRLAWSWTALFRTIMNRLILEFQMSLNRFEYVRTSEIKREQKPKKIGKLICKWAARTGLSGDAFDRPAVIQSGGSRHLSRTSKVCALQTPKWLAVHTQKWQHCTNTCCKPWRCLPNPGLLKVPLREVPEKGALERCLGDSAALVCSHHNILSVCCECWQYVSTHIPQSTHTVWSDLLDLHTL